MAEFPSVEWFDALAAKANEKTEELSEFGFAYIRLACRINGLPGGDKSFGVRIEGYDVASDGEIEPGSWGADCVLEGPSEAWFAMISSIQANGAADLSQTLNALTIAEDPMKVTGDDPMGRDLFYRFNQTLQELFDLAADIPTELPVGA